MPDVGLEEIRPAQLVLGRHGIDSDHPVDIGVALNASYEPAPQLPCDSSDEHDLSQDQPFLPTLVPRVSRAVTPRYRVVVAL